MDYNGEDTEDIEVQERLRKNQKKVATTFASLAGRASHFLSKKKPEAKTHTTAVEEGLSIEPDGSNRTVVLQTDSQDEKGDASIKPQIGPVDHRRRMIRSAYSMIRSSMSPPSLSIIISFVISVVPALKALFVPNVSGVNFPSAPDGQPPLAILMNTANFIGAASIPLGLICLGSALARLQLPQGRWRSLPIASITALAAARLLIMPVLGVIVCQSLTHVGIIDSRNNVLRFVCMYVVFFGWTAPGLMETVQFHVMPANINNTGM